uniref:CUB domain-containing protein n=2 Tax=Lepeophtheirus salmonis TaxID=72036 RepID=A0A0K2T5M8_LEPSM
MIPGASKKTNSAPIPTIGAHGLCGSKFAPTDGATVSKTICSKAVPFNIRFLSDEREQFTKEKGKNPNGFKLFYEMFPCT